VSRLVTVTREENAMQLVDRLGGDLPRSPVTVELDDILWGSRTLPRRLIRGFRLRVRTG
jgi:hypothetical protein